MARRLGLAAGLSLFGLLLFGPAASAQVSQAAAGMVFDRLVPGFVGEARNANGYATGTAFAAPNPWGAYTAYRLATDARGRRTWRIENYVPLGNFMQGSTMYLLEGDRKALLVDTAQKSVAVAGKNDLKSVVRYLLGHNGDGQVGNVAFTVLHEPQPLSRCRSVLRKNLSTRPVALAEVRKQHVQQGGRNLIHSGIAAVGHADVIL